MSYKIVSTYGIRDEIKKELECIQITSNNDYLMLKYNDKEYLYIPDKKHYIKSWSQNSYHDYLLLEAYFHGLKKDYLIYEFSFDSNELDQLKKSLIIAIILFYHGNDDGFKFLAYYELLDKPHNGRYLNVKGKHINYYSALKKINNYIEEILFKSKDKPTRRHNFTEDNYVSRKMVPLLEAYCVEQSEITKKERPKNKRNNNEWDKIKEELATELFHDQLKVIVKRFLHNIPVKNKPRVIKGL